METLLTRLVGVPDSHRIDTYVARGGYEGLRKALKMTPDAVIDEVKKANLRGRGGAGFPCGTKWSFVDQKSPKPKYMVVNADEGEPGTFKDRLLMEWDPHGMLEGTIIGSYAIRASTAYIYVRGELRKSYDRVMAAVAEAYDKGFLGKNVLGSGWSCDVTVHRGAGAYICGEETALLNSLEGKRGQPRFKPPFPAVVGLFGAPTIVNNVETLACVPWIVTRGSAWFASAEAGGVEGNGGPKLYCISGHVNRPGVYELPHSTTGLGLIDAAGGITGGRALKAFIPGGSSTPPLTPAESDVRMDFDSVKKAGSLLGSAGAIALRDGTCLVRFLWKLLKFYHHESCGQCTPCREGTGWLERIAWKLEHGQGSVAELGIMEAASKRMIGTTICVLSDAAAMPALDFYKKWKDEFVGHVGKKGPCDLEA
ncbi:MAG TPA: NADH-quinone oxidoreductase subunit NuoF [Myxococcota bacterium]|jgi:NADH-quinone oxidoreductase subunit F|nr:NADH-quinone oxidoreductase subunit NuoF [Myxococcota bacterium]